ncbi:Glycosyl hydrolase family 115 [Amycolatopsis marina]|uniref:Glycosyl hydrolase family 115 n=1 Tax=Amycolatopsis marina TaxID=490629 RepID=A0A1I0XDS9_9PSEU|nr:glycosyl hydrolase 115 family protein [Amycolatopsis marina]SFA99044.1 Glycosyl hydrolase family 115 [Amycolatopsis marina]
MLGVGDVSLSYGGGIELMRNILDSQRAVLDEVLDVDIAEIPQVQTLYKAVQRYRDNMCKLPEQSQPEQYIEVFNRGSRPFRYDIHPGPLWTTRGQGERQRRAVEADSGPRPHGRGVTAASRTPTAVAPGRGEHDDDVQPVQWQRNTSDNVNRTVTAHTVGRGEHPLKIWMVDPTVVTQKIVVDPGGLKPGYLGSPESHHTHPRW